MTPRNILIKFLKNNKQKILTSTPPLEKQQHINRGTKTRMIDIFISKKSNYVNVNDLRPIKMQKVSNWAKNNICCLKETCFSLNDTNSLKLKDGKNFMLIVIIREECLY